MPILGEILLNEGLINEEKLDFVLDEQVRTKEKLGAILVNLGYLSERDLLKVLAIQLRIPVLIPDDYPPVPPAMDIQPSLKFLRQYRVVPVQRNNGVLKVATANPQDPYPLEALRACTGLKIEPVLGAEGEILDVIEAYYGSGAATMDKIIEGIGGKDGCDSALDIEDIEQLKDMALEAPIINLVNMFITRAVEKLASDIHVEPFDDMLHVRYRIDGMLYHIESVPKRLHLAIASRIKITAKLNIAERRLPQDGRFKIKASGRDVDIRVSTVPTLYGESIVLRLLYSNGLISVEGLGFDVPSQRAFSNLIRQPHGMILVTGPTGSGKTTTLYAAMSMIDTVEKKVITIEDPVEYNIEGVNQIQVKPKIGLTFANGLRSIVRQDPDVIMVGEIRDAETADIAVHSALTGHLLFSTLHTNDAPGAVIRLIDMGVENYLISSSLIGVLAQRLVRVICNNCKTGYRPDAQTIHMLGQWRKGALDGDVTLYRGAGCEECDGTGYRGRIGIFELMPISEGIRNLIVENKGSNILRQAAIEGGMTTLRQDGWSKALGGITTLDEVTRVTLDQ